MQRIRRKPRKNQRREARRVVQAAIPLDDGTVTRPVTLAMILALIPLGLRAVKARLRAEVVRARGAPLFPH
jgi:hypothetical protein